MKKIITILALLFVLLLGGTTTITAQTATAPAAGSGTSADPYQIATIDNLYWLSQNSAEWSKYYIQTADIDASATSTWHSGAGFSPIGNGTTKFQGTYNGQNHTISNLFINRSTTDNIGLFGYTNGATISNIGIISCNITGKTYVGGLVGTNYNNSSISNSYSTGSVTASGSVGGGLVGYNNSSSISNSYSTGSVSGGNTQVGGLVGYNYDSSISNSYSTGSVSGKNQVGGLVGTNITSTISATISNSYSLGNVTRSSDAFTYFGGLVGVNFSSTIQYCYSTGKVYSSAGTIWNEGSNKDKGFVGFNNGGTYTNNFFDSEASEQTDDCVNATTATAKTTAEMKTQAIFTGWDFTGETTNGTNDYWSIAATNNDGYPYLAWQVFPSPAPTITSFTPESGAIGSSVTITGTNFNATAAQNIVFFGATKAVVTAASALSLTVTVPLGATYQYLTVTNLATQLTAYSAKPFNVTLAGSMTFTDEVSFKAYREAGNVSIMDIDGDGKPDLVGISNAYPYVAVSILRNTSSSGSLSFAAKVDSAKSTGFISVSIGDIDGDGKPDLVVANLLSNIISVFLNTSTPGSVSFATKVDFPTGSGPNSLIIGDIDGDGKPDLVVANNSPTDINWGNTVSVFLNTSTLGSVSFATKVDFLTGDGPNSVSIGDIDGDGKVDLAVANFSNTVSLLRNTSISGTVSFAAKVDFATGNYSYFVSIGDIDGDGKADLAVVNTESNDVSVLRNTSSSGSVSFATKVDFATASDPYSVSIGDIDGDGKPDLALPNSNNNTVTVFRNTSISGTVSFAAKVDFAAGNYPSSVSIGDIDGDGKPDLVVSNPAESKDISVIRQINPVQVTASLGTTTGVYTTLKAAFDSINSGYHKGVITIQIKGSIIETASAKLNANGSGSAVYSAVTIYPTVTGLSISGAIDGPLIDLNGADNVSIDGRVNATGSTKDLIITNTSTSGIEGTSTLRFIESAENNIIKYCKVKGSAIEQNPVYCGIIYFAASSTGNGNDSDTIDNCDITSSTAGRATIAVLSIGSSSSENSGIIISNNNIYDYSNPLYNSLGIHLYSNSSAWKITGNSFYETTSFVPAAGDSYGMIVINSGNNYEITNNFMGGSSANCNGIWEKSAANSNHFYGIYLVTDEVIASSIQGNTIKNINWSNNGSSPWFGIFVSTGNVNIGNITGNTIGSPVGTASIQVNQGGNSSGDVYGILCQNSGTANIRNNTIGSFTLGHSNAAYAANFYGIKLGGGPRNAVISNNIIGSTTEAASINATSISTSTAQNVSGIRCDNTGSNNITGNTIANLTNANSTTGGTVKGIDYNSSVTSSTVNGNFIHSLSSSSNNTALYGIFHNSGPITYSNNIISLGSDVTTGNEIYGIKMAATSDATINMYYNTVYIGGTVSGTTNSTFALSNGATFARNYRNNIFNNSRSGGTTGKHYAISLSNNTDLTINYNDYYAPNGVLGIFNGDDKATLANWKTSSGGDIHSKNANPIYASAGGTLAENYKPSQPTLQAVSGTGVLLDYDSASRSLTIPAMGAWEYTLCTAPSISSQSTAGNTQCAGGTFDAISVTATGDSLSYQWYSNATANSIGGTSLDSLNGAQTNSYTPQATSADTLYYYCVVSGTCGVDTSAVSGAFITKANTTVGAIVTVGQPMTLHYMGSFGPTSTLNGTAFGVETPFDITATFYPANNSSPYGGIGIYAAESFAISITNHGNYNALPSPNLNIVLVDSTDQGGNYATGIGDAYLDYGFYSTFSSATPAFLGNMPVASVLFGYNNGSVAPPYTLPLVGAGNLVVNDIYSLTPATAVLTMPNTTETQCLYGTFDAISVTATGDSLSYQWYSNTIESSSDGIAVGGNANTYTPQSTEAGTLYYYCVVTGSCGADTSAVSGAFIVKPATSISSQSSLTQTQCLNGTFDAISVTATGDSLSYQWYSNTTADSIGGTSLGFYLAQSETYTPQSTEAGTLYYYCVVTGSCGADTSAVSGAFIVKPATFISSLSADAQTTVINGSFTPISVSAIGSNLTYQWYSNTINDNLGGISLDTANGAQTDTYTPQAGAVSSRLFYYCEVSGDCGTQWTNNYSGVFIVSPNFTTPTGDGSISNPYLIANLENLTWLQLTKSVWNNSSYFLQTANINAGSTTIWYSGAGFPGIGDYDIAFNGHYNGGGFTIDSLFVNNMQGFFAGMFFTVDSANLHDIHLTNAVANSFIAAGILSGAVSNSTIELCSTSGNVNTLIAGGGLIGYGKNISVQSCYSNANVNGFIPPGIDFGIDYTGQLGGLIGNIDGNATIITDCYARGSVTGDYNIGGLIGGFDFENTFSNGGIGIPDTSMGFTMTNSYAANTLTALGIGAIPGGILGQSNYAGTHVNITNTYWDGQLSNVSNGFIGGTPKLTSEMKTQSTFTGFDFTTPVWSISSSYNDGYPNLDGESSVLSPTVTASAVTVCTSATTVDIPITVSNLSNVGSFSLTFGFNPTELSNPVMVSRNPIFDLSGHEWDPFEFTTDAGLLAAGSYKVSALSFNAADAVSLAPNSVLFTLRFDLGSFASTTALNFAEDIQGLACEFTGVTPDYTPYIDSPAATYYISGEVIKNNPTSNTISGTQAICYNTTADLTGSLVSGASGSVISYQWTSCSTLGGVYLPVSTNGTSQDYTTNALIADTWFKREVTSVLNGISCSTTSDTVKVSINPVSIGGSVTGTSTITYGTSTGTMTLGSYTGTVQKWQKKFNTGGWIDISNTNTTYSEIPTAAGNWFYRAVVKSGACTEKASDSLKVIVNTKALTIKAEDKSKNYDGLIYNPSLYTVTYTGLVTGETSAVLSGTLLFSGNATTATNVGNYTITPSNLTSTNYAISFQNGTLSINNPLIANVLNNSDAGYGSLRNAIANVSDGGTVTFDIGVNGQTITLTTGALNINKKVTLNNSNLTNGITITGSGTNITINAGKVLTLSSGSKLTVTGAINNTAKGPAGLVIASGASFIHNTVDLPATVQRNLTNVWHLFGSPFKKNTGAMLANITGTTKMMPYTNGTGWGTTTTSPVTLFVPSVGYAIKPSSTVTASFTGNLYYSAIPADYTTSLIYNGTSANQSWNLVANPYTASIDFNLLGKTNLSSTLYYWDNAYKPNVTPIASASYMRTYNSCNGVGVPAGTLSYIAPLQGFFVKAVYTSPKLAFTPSARVHKPITYYKDASNTEILVRLQTETEEGTDELVICKNENSKLDFEQFDSEKLFNDSPVEIYSQSASGENLVINTINVTANNIIPLGIRGNAGKKVKITAFALETAEQVYLEDRFKGKLISLTENTAYEFELPTENLIGRFFIRFNNSNTALTTSDVKVFENNNELNIIAQTGEDLQTVEVYSLTGACVFKAEGNTNVFNTKLQLAPAVYMVRVKTSIATQNVKVSWK